jgi:NAD(P)-dependent dehydrogenase (short-subunit alcohol dehydrogenase family)
VESTPEESRPLAGQVAIVTGGASGIGLSTSLLLGRNGATVVVFGRDEAQGAAAVAQLQELGARGAFFAVDLADADAIAPAVDRVVEEFGAVDILVNNAAVRGIGAPRGRTGLFDISADDWDFVQAVNLRAPFLLVREAARHMIERGQGGHIVNVTSSAAFQAKGTSPHYSASKAALTSLTRTAAAELGVHGINVNAVAPGLTRTPYRVERMRNPDGFERMVSEGPLENLLHSVAESEDVAEVILFLCLPASRQLTAQTLHTSAGYII